MSFTPQVLTVPKGGTGATTLTDRGVLVGRGTSAVVSTAVGTAGQILTSNGAGSDPSFQSLGLTGILDYKDSARVATAAALPANTFALNVLTATGNGALTIDGVGVSTGNRVLVKDEAVGENNGIYVVTDAGSGATPYILTRSTDADTSAEVTNGLYVYIGEGTVNATRSYVLATLDPITLNTTPLVFVIFSVAGGAPANAEYVTLSTNGTLTGERVLTGTTNQIAITDGGGGGNVTLSTPQNIHTGATPTFAGLTLGVTPLAVTSGGLGAATFTDGGVLVGNGTGAVQVTTAGTAGQVLTSNGAGVDPSFQAATGAPTNASYLVLGLNGTLSDERVLTGTANQVVLTDGGAGGNLTLSLPQSIATTSIVTFGGVITGALREGYRAVGAGSDTILTTDLIIGKTAITGGGDTLTLPAAATAAVGRIYEIKDESASAATNNLTIVGNGAETIDGAANFVINVDGGAVRLYCNGSAWFVI